MLRTIFTINNKILTNKSSLKASAASSQILFNNCLHQKQQHQRILKSHYTIRTTSSTNNNTRLVKTIYRSLLRTSKPFSHGKYYKIYLSLLHRSTTTILDIPNGNGNDDTTRKDHAKDLSSSTKQEQQNQNNEEYYQLYIRKILHELFKDDNTKYNLLRFPSQINNNNTTLTLYQIIQREFRNAQENTNINLALFILKLLNQKFYLANDVLQLYNYCDNSLSEEINNNDDDKCWNVVEDISSMNTSNTNNDGNYYLIAHPLLSGYFARTIILLLDHDNDPNSDETTTTPATPATPSNTNIDIDTAVPPYRGTYGLIINRKTNIILQNAITNLPINIQKPFGGCDVNDGGPVNVSLQMITSSSDDDDKIVKDIDVQPITSYDNNNTNANNYYRNGDIIKASTYDNNDNKTKFNFFIGASCWVQNQLQEELGKGFWLLVQSKDLEEKLLNDLFIDNKSDDHGDDAWNNIYKHLECNDDSILANSIYDCSIKNDKDSDSGSSKTFYTSNDKINFLDCYVPFDEF